MKFEWFKHTHLNRFKGRATKSSHSRTIVFKHKPYYVKFPDLIFWLEFTRIPSITLIQTRHGYQTISNCRFRFQSLAVTGPNREHLLLPNMHTNQTVCLAGDVNVIKKNPDMLFEAAINRFFTSKFSQSFIADEEKTFIKFLKQGVISFYRWPFEMPLIVSHHWKPIEKSELTTRTGYGEIH